MSHKRSFTSGVAVTATFVAAVCFGTEPAAAVCGLPPTHGGEPVCRLGTHLQCHFSIGHPVSWSCVPDAPKIQFRPMQGPLQSIPPRIEKPPMTRTQFGPPKPMPVSRIR